MIIYEFTEEIDNNIELFSSSINNKSTCFIGNIFLMHRLHIFPYFRDQKR